MTHPPLTRARAEAVVVALLLTGFALAGCGGQSTQPTAPTTSPWFPPSPTATASLSPSGTLTPTPARTREPPDLKGQTRNAIAFAPLSDPEDITVLGSVSDSRAWSTSKVLVVLAYIQTLAGGDPDNLTTEQRDLIELALTESDMDALLTLRAQIPGGSGAPMTQILRSIGDKDTTAPDIREGLMEWGLRDQVKFMAALSDGRVVSKKASKYVLANMKPVKSESWGLGTIGASAFKGGWLEPSTETRQMGIVGDYAVAIITNGVGPAELQIDGDYAHVRQMNRLARILEKNLAADQAAR
ncbi:MAG: hypothetical protein V9E98_07900 [Candidatus Nanopelagicales bacterium]